jgi:hypothetical protein
VGAAIVLLARLAAGIIVAWLLVETSVPEGLAVFAFLVCAGIGGVLVYRMVTRYAPASVELDKAARYETVHLQEIAFSPDGIQLASAGRDPLVRIYAFQIEDLVTLGQARLTHRLTTEECQKFRPAPMSLG